MFIDNVKFRVPKSVYDELISVFGSRDAAIDAVSLYVDIWIRDRLPKQDEELIELDLYIYDKFHKKMNTYMLEQGLSIDEHMSKIIKRLCRRKKLRSAMSELAQTNKLKKDQA